MYDLFFGKFTLSISRFVKMLTDTRGIIFLALGCILLFATDPNYLRGAIGPGFAFLVWTCSVALYLVTIIVILALFSVTQAFLGRYPIYTPITSSLALLFVYVCAQSTIGYFTDEGYQTYVYPQFFNILGAGIVIETIFVRFVLPLIFPDLAQPEEEPDLIRIGDRQFPLINVIYLNAQEHYIQIAMQTDKVMIRARLCDAVAQTTPSQGLQPHRSWWVAVTARPSLTKEDGKPVLKLSDGTIVPIAAARLKEVQRWMDMYRNW